MSSSSSAVVGRTRHLSVVVRHCLPSTSIVVVGHGHGSFAGRLSSSVGVGRRTGRMLAIPKIFAHFWLRQGSCWRGETRCHMMSFVEAQARERAKHLEDRHLDMACYPRLWFRRFMFRCFERSLLSECGLLSDASLLILVAYRFSARGSAGRAAGFEEALRIRDSSRVGVGALRGCYSPARCGAELCRLNMTFITVVAPPAMREPHRQSAAVLRRNRLAMSHVPTHDWQLALAGYSSTALCFTFVSMGGLSQHCDMGRCQESVWSSIGKRSS